MSSCPGSTLEDFVTDMFVCDLTASQMAAIVAVLEPARDYIEYRVSCYDPDEHSWRDYRNGIISYIDEPLLDQCNAIARAPQPAPRLGHATGCYTASAGACCACAAPSFASGARPTGTNGGRNSPWSCPAYWQIRRRSEG